MKNRSPFLLKLLAFLFFCASFYYFLQSDEAIHNWNILIIAGYRFSPLYPFFQGLILGGAFLVQGVILLMRIYWATEFGTAAVFLAAIWYWLDRTILSMNPQRFSQQIFAILATGIVLFLIVGGLWALQPYMKLSERAKSSESMNDSFPSGEKNE